jgi:uncharacterized protein
MPAAENFAHMLDLIVCPACRGLLTIRTKDSSILCSSCGRRYSVQDGIPVLIPERATS